MSPIFWPRLLTSIACILGTFYIIFLLCLPIQKRKKEKKKKRGTHNKEKKGSNKLQGYSFDAKLLNSHEPHCSSLGFQRNNFSSDQFGTMPFLLF